MSNLPFLTVEESLQFVDESIKQRDIYEFGVYQGKTLCELVDGFLSRKILPYNIFGFDSFQGLPKESPIIQWINPDWKEGEFNVVKDLGFKDVSSAMIFVYNKVKSIYEDKHKIKSIGESIHPYVHLVPGFFTDTLNKYNFYQLGMDVRKAAYIHIDTDIYISTYECLDFCFKFKIPAEDTIIRFDDIASTPWGIAGQSLAWIKMENKYKIQSDRLAYNVFRINSYDY